MQVTATQNLVVEGGQIEIYGAREHNLKGVDLIIPRNKLICFTGLSGSGKSSLAFDTVYAEGQRRYMETFSAYARQFMGSLKRPEVDKINGLSPVISIEQKTVSKNPRSTVGTITEIYDFLRLLFARGSEAYSYVTGNKVIRFSDEQILDAILKQFADQSVYILAPLVKRRKGHYRELFEGLQKQGYTRVRVDGDVQEIVSKMQLSRYKIHDIELVVDRIRVNEEGLQRLRTSVDLALKQGKGNMSVLDMNEENQRHYSRNLMCLESGVSYDEPQPNSFSFNSPYGWCTRCKGLGFSYQFEMDAIFPNRDLSIKNGGIAPFGKDIDYWSLSIIKAVLKKHSFKLTDPISKLSEDAIQEMLYGSDEKLKVDYNYNEFNVEFDGLVRHFESVIIGNSGSGALKEALEGIGHLADCPECNGYRLKQEALYFKVGDKNIGEAATMQLDLFYEWILEHNKTLTDRERLIAGEIIKEISTRTKFLLDVGLTYLTLHRPAFSLSGGEAQRIRLATQIGSQLINVTYILDEPSIGLHQRDNVRLIDALKNLRDIGNTVIVVEHDKDMILASDYIVDIGPGAGTHGGKIVAEGNAEEILTQNSLTVQYLNGTREIATPTERRPGNGDFLELKGATGHNLKNVNIKLPLGTLICVTGVSGSGKSTLITDTLYPILKKYYFRSNAYAMPHKSVSGLEKLDKVIEIDQSPIGRTPRSNPATYTALFTHIRSLFVMLPEAKIRGYAPGRFSFNVKGGRCEECGGAGIKTVEMNFLPDVYVECPVCLGKRYNRETLEVRYKGKSISDVLDMTVEHAVDFFEMIPAIKRKLQTLNDVGLGYIRLGQSSTTLSGGEAQRVKLATELSKKDTGKTFYILDEPTTGLHFEDIRILMEVLTKLVDRGNTVLIIEHNLDVIKLADYIIDLGPEGGNGGGKIIADGTPEVVAMSKKSITGKFLRKELGM
ncbi:MAG: excinuclease ABC subunit UvrA [Bacteroidia bacterium]